MVGTTADKLEYLQGTKAAIKEAIVNKGVAVPDGTTFRAYAEKIGSIVKVPSLSNPGSAGDLRSGKQLAGADGSIVTGTLPEVIQATPTISVSSGGLITASATQSGGIVAAGSKSATQQLTTQGAKTVTPTTTNQTAVASGRYTTGDVVVSGDANLVPENIAEGVSIFGVTGAHSGGGSVEIYTGTSVGVLNKFYYLHTLTLPVSSDKTLIGCFYIPNVAREAYFGLSTPDGLEIISQNDATNSFGTVTRSSDSAIIIGNGPETYQYYFVAFA